MLPQIGPLLLPNLAFSDTQIHGPDLFVPGKLEGEVLHNNLLPLWWELPIVLLMVGKHVVQIFGETHV